MVWERCGKRPISTVSTALVDGRKVASYLCDFCRSEGGGGSVSSPERPCVRCGVREGTVKFVQMKGGLRNVSYLCEVCASSGGRRS